MINKIHNWLNRRYPQNYIISRPYIGSLVIVLFCLTFILLYKPLNSHPGQSLSYELTMTAYCLSMTAPIVLFAWLIKQIKFFSIKEEWTILKEIVSIIIILLAIGITIYLMAFLLEEPAKRWNVSTFMDSCLNAFLVCFIPFTYFSFKNYRYSLPFETNIYSERVQSIPSEKQININSKLKNERLSFYPSQFLYAISDGNYVNFYLNDNNEIKKETIRNSISNIEEQLLKIPYLLRIHRAFIINIKMVIKKKGNSLGYKVNIKGIDEEIPVSRKKIQIFNKLFNEYY